MCTRAWIHICFPSPPVWKQARLLFFLCRICDLFRQLHRAVLPPVNIHRFPCKMMLFIFFPLSCVNTQKHVLYLLYPMGSTQSGPQVLMDFNSLLSTGTVSCHVLSRKNRVFFGLSIPACLGIGKSSRSIFLFDFCVCFVLSRTECMCVCNPCAQLREASVGFISHCRGRTASREHLLSFLSMACFS